MVSQRAESTASCSDVPTALDDAQRYGAVPAALRAVFMEDGDVGLFSKHMTVSIRGTEDSLLAAATKSRLRLHDNSYDLLDARDLLSEEGAKLEAAEHCISEATNHVAKADNSLKGHIKARQNLDESLEIISRTRGLVRMFGRAESMVSSRNFHAALRMLDRLDMTVASSVERQVLSEIVPATAPLRAEINSHIRRCLYSWLAAVRSELPSIGSYALALALNDRTGSTSATPGMSAGSVSDVTADGPNSSEAQMSHWVPCIREDDRTSAAAPGRRMHRGSSANAARLRGSPDSSDLSAGHSATTSSGPKQLRRRELKHDSNNAPSITMRPLLTCVQAVQDMDKLEDFAEDYERERTNQLGAGMDSICSSTLSQSGSESTSVSLLAEQHAAMVTYVAGFFVSERAVELHSGVSLLRRATAVNLCRFARDKIGKLSATILSHGDTNALRFVRKSEMSLARWANAYGLNDVQS